MSWIESYLNILQCPNCSNKLEYMASAEFEEYLVCVNCEKVYPIIDNIPIFVKG